MKPVRRRRRRRAAAEALLTRARPSQPIRKRLGMRGEDRVQSWSCGSSVHACPVTAAVYVSLASIGASCSLAWAACLIHVRSCVSACLRA